MKKGFTLIELLAVIVILAIIAVIAAPIVLNIIEESKNNATLRSADFYLDAVEYAIADAYLYHGGLTDGEYPITSDGNLCKTDLPCSEENILKVQVNGDTPDSGKITITSGSISQIELVYKEKTIVKNSKGELVYQEGKKVCTYVDSEDDTGDAIGKIDLSDVVTCAGENFYVMKNENNQITMLSMYNLYVGYYGVVGDGIPYGVEIEKPTGIQNEKAKGFIVGDIDGDHNYYGAVKFSSTGYWSSDNEQYNEDGTWFFPFLPEYGSGFQTIAYVYDENADEIYPYVSSYEEYLKKNGVKSARATLMHHEQLEDLGCTLITPTTDYNSWFKDGTCASAPSWVYSTSYWIGSTSSVMFSSGVWYYGIHNVSTTGSVSTAFSYVGEATFFGVRPVVTISTSEI